MTEAKALNASQREIVSLLCSEIDELYETDCKKLSSLSHDDLGNTLYELSVHLDHIGNAVELAGLSALSTCSKYLSHQYAYYSEHNSEFDKPQLDLSTKWGPLFHTYLESLNEGLAFEDIARDIIVLIQDSNWATHLPDSMTTEIAEQFNVSHTQVLNDESDSALPTHVTQEMCSLTIDENIRHELLQGLLIELPQQVQQFEDSLNLFLDTSNLADLNQAQRIAHTIKGAANIVSVTGLANLMHYTEELLEKSAKRWNEAPEGFSRFLQQVSDCLAEISDFLNKRGPHPEDIQATLDQILTWLSQIHSDNEKPGHTSEPLKTVETVNTPPSPPPLPNQDSGDDDTYFINLPGNIAQELLRLSGETHISHNQMNAQVDLLQDAIKVCENHQKKIQGIASRFEHLVQSQNAQRAAAMRTETDELDPLELEQFNELHSFSNQLIELTTDSYESTLRLEKQMDALDGLLYAQNQLNRENQRILLDINLVSVSSYGPRFSRCVRQACRQTNKVASLEIVGSEVLVDNHVLSHIIDPLMHLLRNAVDHGLENNRYDREQKGKSPEGKIRLSFFHQGETIKILCEDDGDGIDYDAVSTKALERGLIDNIEKCTKQELNQIIFLPGFSTRDNATQTSGRGVGLDAVMESIKELKGNIQIDSSEGQGSLITLTVPSSILTAHAIVIETQHQHKKLTYSLLGRAIEQIFYVQPKQIVRKKEGNFFLHEDNLTPVYPVNDMLGFGSGDLKHTHALLLCKKDNDEYIFVAVDSISASQELVIKSFNDKTYAPPGVVGATIMGDGSVSPVIDIHSLPGMSLDHSTLTRQHRQREQIAALEKTQYKTPPAALIVDDSLSARRSLSQLVSDIGMDVITAKDGFDAISKIEKQTPSILIVDLEMPRMNGLELTAHLRSREEYKNIPVIMMTSRSTDRHKILAENAGVNTYLTKPWSEDELLQSIEKQIA